MRKGANNGFGVSRKGKSLTVLGGSLMGLKSFVCRYGLSPEFRCGVGRIDSSNHRYPVLTSMVAECHDFSLISVSNRSAAVCLQSPLAVMVCWDREDLERL